MESEPEYGEVFEVEAVGSLRYQEIKDIEAVCGEDNLRPPLDCRMDCDGSLGNGAGVLVGLGFLEQNRTALRGPQLQSGPDQRNGSIAGKRCRHAVCWVYDMKNRDVLIRRIAWLSQHLQGFEPGYHPSQYLCDAVAVPRNRGFLIQSVKRARVRLRSGFDQPYFADAGQGIVNDAALIRAAIWQSDTVDLGDMSFRRALAPIPIGYP